MFSDHAVELREDFRQLKQVTGCHSRCAAGRAERERTQDRAHLSRCQLGQCHSSRRLRHRRTDRGVRRWVLLLQVFEHLGRRSQHRCSAEGTDRLAVPAEACLTKHLVRGLIGQLLVRRSLIRAAEGSRQTNLDLTFGDGSSGRITPADETRSFGCRRRRRVHDAAGFLPQRNVLPGAPPLSSRSDHDRQRSAATQRFRQHTLPEHLAERECPR